MLICVSKQLIKIVNPSLILPSTSPIIPTFPAIRILASSLITYALLNKYLRYQVLATTTFATSVASDTLLTLKLPPSQHYCNAVYMNVPLIQITRLQSLRSSLARTLDNWNSNQITLKSTPAIFKTLSTYETNSFMIWLSSSTVSQDLSDYFKARLYFDNVIDPISLPICTTL